MHWNRRVWQVGAVALGLIAVASLALLQDAWAQASGSIRVTVRADGQPAKAQVKVMTAAVESQEVASGEAGAPISVPAGRYDVLVTCTELLDHPTQQLRDVEVGGGATVERELSFPAGTVTLHVKKGRSLLRNKELILSKVKGAECPGRGRTEQPMKLSPGRYEATIKLGKRNTSSISGIQVYEGAIRHIPVQL